ncbi:MAG: TIGR04053 family radical SAM/SPASM domain-containing protein [Thermoproteus sp.]|nr:TIGR04053 family radical SAM/SPASM domain-containing protein [Thermoproteus sp.]
MNPRRLVEEFDKRPLLVFWESTRACPLSCKHCRANAILKPLPGELATWEAKALMEQVAEFGKPYPELIVTGGDPLMRLDLLELLDYAKSLGLRASLAPAVSKALFESIPELKGRVHGASISLDGLKDAHEELRGSPGLFEATLEAVKALQSAGIKVQINTVVWRKSLRQLPDVLKLIYDLGVRVWEVFFLVETGRAVKALDISPREYEDAVQFLVDASRYGVQIRTVEAPFYRRAKLQRLSGARYESPLYGELASRLRALMGEPKRPLDPAIVPTRDGHGIIFVAYDGSVYPSGFLPYVLGNVRRESLVRIYREHPLLVKMRRGELGGRCGVCEYRDVCGGSRARAFAAFKDPLAEDPACVYQPQQRDKAFGASSL